jgi:hypothetical protein
VHHLLALELFMAELTVVLSYPEAIVSKEKPELGAFCIRN